MEQWSSDIWIAVVAAFVVGAIIGAVILRATNGNVKKQHVLQKELKEARASQEEHKAQLEQHFQESANLLSTLAEDYKKLYTHLAQSSQTLLPEEVNHKIEFFKQEDEKSEEITKEEPKDYSEGSSGLLKS
ncbi:YhcB family protein [Otariodibacter oris]|uniref:Z-ring associated protein G n=1 Tax=Otariodibacter oris TaxID=1032623 RepID=A0A420XIF2_9PAST|nr:DUF1043 family protein [Otariodibacter oris]QGM80804.1 hypothetical protein A6A10_05000 [Otariodibacter oris]RKR77026.1 hypothetical protein DES31_0342 [Otariodibacter oris]